MKILADRLNLFLLLDILFEWLFSLGLVYF